MHRWRLYQLLELDTLKDALQALPQLHNAKYIEGMYGNEPANLLREIESEIERRNKT